MPSEHALGIDMLAEAGVILSSETDPARLLGSVTRLCAEHFADCAAAYLDPPGVPLAVAVKDGGSEAYAALSADQFEQAAVAAGLAVHREPLVAGDRVVGELCLLLSSADSIDELRAKILRTLCAMTSTALERDRSHAAQHRVADRLQRALLPSSLPQIGGFAFDSSYRPATAESDVGGDWYDAFEIGDGRIGISVGDVAGHGLDAAVIMGEVRRAIRVMAGSFQSPAALLDYVDGTLALQGGVEMATALAGYLDPRTRVLQYACAGHPPPIYVGANRVPVTLPGGGLPLGVSQNIASPDWRVALAPGASLFMYTDGLLEYTHDILAGERRLRETLGALSFDPDANAAVELHDRIFSHFENNDDVATLALRAFGAPDTPLHLQYSSHPAFGAPARDALRTYARSIGFSEEQVSDVLAAVGEAVANAVEHGTHEDGGGFGIITKWSGEALEIEVHSEGRWREFVPGKERGRGMQIMHALANGVQIVAQRSHTSVRLRFSSDGR